MSYSFVDEPTSEKPQQLEQNAAMPFRGVTRQLYNVGTRAIGLPGDVLSLVNEYISNPILEVTGQEKVPYEKTLHGQFIPTTETHRKVLEGLTGDYFKPKNKVEEFVDEVVEDTALLLSPTKIAKGAATLKRPFFTSVIGNLLKEGVKDFSGSDTAGSTAKIGSFITLALLSPESAAKQLSTMYKKAEASLPSDATVNASRLSKEVSSLESRITRGRPVSNLAPSEKFVYEEIKKINELIKDGRANVSQLWAQKRSLNEALQKHVFESGTKDAQVRAKELAKPLNHFLSNALAEYGKENPYFYKNLKAADEGFGAIARSNLLSNWVQNNVKYSPMTQGLLHLFGGSVGNVMEKAAVPYHAAKIMYRINKSPVLKKIYMDAYKSAAQENIASFNKYLRQLDESVQEEESKDKYSFVD